MDTLLDTAVAYPAGMELNDLIASLTAAPMQAPLTEDVILEDYGQGMVYHGCDAVVPVLRAFFGDGFSDGRMCVHTTLADKPDFVIAFIFNGRQDGRFLGIPATGRAVAVPMILLCKAAEDVICHISWYYDAGTILRQLGLTL